MGCSSTCSSSLMYESKIVPHAFDFMVLSGTSRTSISKTCLLLKTLLKGTEMRKSNPTKKSQVVDKINGKKQEEEKTDTRKQWMWRTHYAMPSWLSAELEECEKRWACVYYRNFCNGKHVTCGVVLIWGRYWIYSDVVSSYRYTLRGIGSEWNSHNDKCTMTDSVTQ